jgi:hypothetical protein
MSSDQNTANANMDSSDRAPAGTALSATANTADIRPRYNPGDTHPMTVYDPWIGFTPDRSLNDAWVFMSPDKSVNNDAHFGKTFDTYDILWKNLFMFTTSSDDAVVAVEVAGNSTNTGVWTNLRNAKTTGGNGGMIYKNASFLTLNSGSPSAGESGTGNVGTADVYLDNDTQIIVRTSSTSIATYDGVSALPSNVVLAEGTEVDWADTDNDGRADYLYVEGSVTGVITYGLFYYNAYNGDVARWDGTANSGTISGYLNGEAYTANFKSRTLFDLVNDTANYEAHLFALQFNGDVVTGVLADDARNNVQILNDGSNNSGVTVNVSTGLNVGGTDFQVGSAYGNSYTATTNAGYFKGNTAYQYDNYTNTGRTVTLGGNTYWLTPNCNVIGELEWLNTRGCYVTVVYEDNASATKPRAVSTIYITTDPDVTPDNSNRVATINATAITGGPNSITLNLTSGVSLTNGTNYDLARVYVRDYNTQNLVVSGTSTNGVITSPPDLTTVSGSQYTGTMIITHNSGNNHHVGSYFVKVEYSKGGTLVAQSDWMELTIS